LSIHVQGIENNTPIVTVGCVIPQKHPVITFMHHNADTRKSKCIHSTVQPESYKSALDDKVINVGG